MARTVDFGNTCSAKIMEGFRIDPWVSKRNPSNVKVVFAIVNEDNQQDAVTNLCANGFKRVGTYEGNEFTHSSYGSHRATCGVYIRGGSFKLDIPKAATKPRVKRRKK